MVPVELLPDQFTLRGDPCESHTSILFLVAPNAGSLLPRSAVIFLKSLALLYPFPLGSLLRGVTDSFPSFCDVSGLIASSNVPTHVNKENAYFDFECDRFDF